VVPLSWSLDHAGPVTKTVEDAALILRAIAGHDPKDPTSSQAPVPDYTQALTGDIRGLRLGIPREHFFEDIDPEVAVAVGRAINTLERLGAGVEPVSLPHAKYAPTLLWAIVGSEAASYHEAFFRARAQDYGGDVRASLEVAQFILATHYVKAQRVRSILRQELIEVLRRVDVIVAPTSPVTAPRIGEREVKMGERMVKLPLHLGRLTSPFNLAGLPAISIPCGFNSAGLPIGLQLAGRPFDEETVLRVAHAYEVNTEWHKARPRI
jgi:aspartyl-tRNA(Asn)/glutamyl-tRNA(Gln) amidotransferase subunit A